MIRSCFVALAISWAASSLTLTASIGRAVPQQTTAQTAQQAGEAKQENPGAEGKEKTPKKKPADDSDPGSHPLPTRSFKELGKEFLLDQQQIWTSPAKLRLSDVQWLVPLSGITAGLFVTDRDYSANLSHNPSTISRYNNLSTAGIGALVGGAGGMWLLGHVKHNDHWSETGFLAGEAALNSLVAVEALKYSLSRERPYQGDGSGPFFSGGTSFPSEHAAAAWSIAGVIAHEYPNPLMKFMVYGLASMVDFSRIHGRQHFPSDVFVGSLMGNFIAQDIYTRNHDPGLGGEAWRSISDLFRGDGTRSPANLGSPYVPLDSWVYPAFDRLAALGAIDTGFAGMRPWTRSECARLLVEADGPVNQEGKGGSEAANTYQLLEAEFREELEGQDGDQPFRWKLESVYSRVTGISGEPLVDGNHFGQTLINDFGRPYQEGFNNIDGFSAWATSGHLVGYVRAEYQHAPSAPALPEAARQFIATQAGIPGVSPDTPYAAANRINLLDAYFGLNFENWQVTFGQQSLWWGPMQGGPLMFSDNAAPVKMFRINRITPFKLPSIGGLLGPIRLEMFLGQLAGHEFVFQSDTGIVGQFGQPIGRQPFIQGEKFSFKPSPNFEFGVCLTVVFGGGPGPLTLHTFLRSYSLGQGQNAELGSGPTDPGDRRSGVDFTYKVPGLRNWATFYGDAFTEDEFSPLGYPRKSAIEGGIYFPHIPGIPKLDLRGEGGSTVPPDYRTCIGCFYNNTRYPDGSYLNSGNIMGSWLGHAGQGEQVWSTYWISSRNKIQFNYRRLKVSSRYLPQGGELNDAGVNADFWLNSILMLSGSVQYEKWNFPILAPLPKSDVATSIELTIWPHSRK